MSLSSIVVHTFISWSDIAESDEAMATHMLIRQSLVHDSGEPSHATLKKLRLAQKLEAPL